MDLMGLLPLNTEEELPLNLNPTVVHDCKVPPEDDEIDLYVSGTGCCAHIHRWLTRQRVVSPKDYFAKTCLRSTTAIKFEILRHLQEYPYMIHPFSPFRNLWCIIMTILILFILSVTPFLVTFYYFQTKDVITYFIITDLILLFDTCLNFFVGYFDERTKTVNFDSRVVFLEYMKSYFVFDILSAFPFELFDEIMTGKHHWYGALFNLFKILRASNLMRHITRIQKSWRISYQKVQIFKVAFSVGLMIHWGACICYLIPLIVMELKQSSSILFSPKIDRISAAANDTNSYEPKSWILSEDFLSRNTMLKKYILCQNRATISIINSYHYLDVSTPEDMLVNLVLTIIGKLRFIFLLANFYQLISTFHSPDKKRLRVMMQLREYMRYKELPHGTQKRLLTHTNYWYKKNLYRDKMILSQLSAPLRESLITHNYINLLQSVDFFKYLPRDAIVQLLNFIKSEIYLLNDTIVKAGTPGQSLFFIGSGTVAVYTGFGKEVCHLEDGAYFGEIALVMENEHRVATVVAIETCEILQVPREAFQNIIKDYPNLLNRLQKVALERLEKTLFLEEIYKLEDPHPRYINISNIRGKKRLG